MKRNIIAQIWKVHWILTVSQNLLSKDVEKFGKCTGLVLVWEEVISKVYLCVNINFVIVRI
jgi:hypothetical protein